MKQVDKISIKELKAMAELMDGNIVKVDVDVVRRIVVVDMPMHFEGEQALLKAGSKQTDLWGINLLPAKYGAKDFIAYDSMINIKPRQNNPSMGINSKEIRSQIETIINEVVYE